MAHYTGQPKEWVKQTSGKYLVQCVFKKKYFMFQGQPET